MNFVEPIRDRKKIAQIKNQLWGQRRYRDLFIVICGGHHPPALGLQIPQTNQRLPANAKGRDTTERRRRGSGACTVGQAQATVACEQIGPGAIVVDLSKPSKSGGYQFRYITQGEIELRDEDLDRLLREYNPHREFIVVLLKTNDKYRIHLGDAPPMGWWDSMTTNIPYSD